MQKNWYWISSDPLNAPLFRGAPKAHIVLNWITVANWLSGITDMRFWIRLTRVEDAVVKVSNSQKNVEYIIDQISKTKNRKKAENYFFTGFKALRNFLIIKYEIAYFWRVGRGICMSFIRSVPSVYKYGIHINSLQYAKCLPLLWVSEN